MKVFLNPTGIYGEGGSRAALLKPTGFGVFELSPPKAISPNIAAVAWEAVWKGQSICKLDTKICSKKPSSSEAQTLSSHLETVMKQN